MNSIVLETIMEKGSRQQYAIFNYQNKISELYDFISKFIDQVVININKLSEEYEFDIPLYILLMSEY